MKRLAIIFPLLALVFSFGPAYALSPAVASTVAQTKGDPYDTYYYEFSVVAFALSVDDNGNLDGENTTFELGSSGKVDVAVFISNDGEFASNGLYIEIYNEEDTFVNSATITITR